MKKVLSSIILAMSLFLVGSLALAAVAPSTAVAEVLNSKTTALVDRSELVKASPQLMEKAKIKLENKFSIRKKSLEEKQKSLMKDIEAYGKNSPTMKKEEKEAAEKKLTEARKGFMAEQNKFQEDLSNAQTEEWKNIEQFINDKVKIVALRKKLELVLDKAAAAYNNLSDITDEVLAEIKKSTSSYIMDKKTDKKNKSENKVEVNEQKTPVIQGQADGSSNKVEVNEQKTPVIQGQADGSSVVKNIINTNTKEINGKKTPRVVPMQSN